MASIRDVAKLAKVSPASVSRILSNDVTYNCTEKTRRDVLNAAKQLNYKVPESYKVKRKGVYRIGCITRLTPERGIDSYYASILEGIRTRLEKYNQRLEFVKSRYDIDTPERLKEVFDKPLDGLIIMESYPKETMDYFKSRVKCIVGIDTDESGIDNIRYNRFFAGCQAMNYLVENGHKKIAYIGSKLPSKEDYQIGRSEAYAKVMDANNFKIEEGWVINCEWSRNICYDKTLELMKSENRPTAIFVGSDHMAMACISAINSLGIKIPDDVSVIGISDIEASKYMTPPLTTIAIPQKSIGEIAVDDLINKLNGDSKVTKQIFIPTELIVRKSVKKI